MTFWQFYSRKIFGFDIFKDTALLLFGNIQFPRRPLHAMKHPACVPFFGKTTANVLINTALSLYQ